jgi:hypothetical protein
LRSIWSRNEEFHTSRRSWLTAVMLMSDIGTIWTLNAPLTISSSCRKCSKPRILDPSVQATFLLPIEGTTTGWRIARGFASGSTTECVAELSPRCFDSAKWTNPPADVRMAKKKAANPPPKLTETEQDLLSHIQDGYQLETNSLGGNPILRRLKDNEEVRPLSANRNTIKAMEQRGLISPGKGRDPLTILWRLEKKAR